MAQLYEGMFLLDNDVVREDWTKAKGFALDLLEKNGATVRTARRWDERVLAYPIKRRQRATYLLAYYEMPREGITGLVRDLDLSERVLRYLLLQAAEVAEGEQELHEAEGGSEFVVPEPPADDIGYYAPIQVEGEEAPEGAQDDDRDGDDDAPEGLRSAPRRATAPASAPASAPAAPAETETATGTEEVTETVKES